jgi:hypothetical protein
VLKFKRKFQRQRVNPLLLKNGLLGFFSLEDSYGHDILIVTLLKVDPYEVNRILKSFYSLLILNGRYRILDFCKIS